MTFKKHTSEPVPDRPKINLRWVGAVAAALGLTPAEPPPSVNLPDTAFRRSKRPQQKRAKRTNMLHVSKRVRHKHRRAARG